MAAMITTVDELTDYYRSSLLLAKRWVMATAVLAGGFFVLLGYVSEKPPLFVFAVIAVVSSVIFHKLYHRKTYQRLAILKKAFPAAWRSILETDVVFYKNLDGVQRLLFEKRVQLFLSEKKVEGVGTEIDDKIRLLVASSAVIPTFAFPAFTYPGLSEVLIYPKSFSKNFETEGTRRMDENIEGMVGNRYMNRSLLLSKTALLAGFNGRAGEDNVGIHEFVHLLDREDGEIDGVPDKLMEYDYVLPWLHLIKKETDRIKRGRSDIDPYAITNNAEFLAVVSEYFFGDPEEFAKNHPELYSFLSDFYNQKPLS
jgi:Mlc titration factor MtfA (ptsG expression regulator)